tara:strand:+ start:1098 stop:1376 length:279 start_codon:yes stop_codon:yes gene_type:complete
MNKYLQFAVADLEPIQVAIGSGLVVGAINTTTVVIHSVDNESVYTLTGTEITVAMGDAINAALIIAAQTNWMKAVSTVQIPIGQAVASIAIT